MKRSKRNLLRFKRIFRLCLYVTLKKNILRFKRIFWLCSYVMFKKESSKVQKGNQILFICNVQKRVLKKNFLRFEKIFWLCSYVTLKKKNLLGFRGCTESVCSCVSSLKIFLGSKGCTESVHGWVTVKGSEPYFFAN